MPADEFQRSLVEKITKAQEAVFDQYSNGHFVWIETEQTNSGIQKRRHEYWARGGVYFRLDTQNLTQPAAKLPISRTIVVPEGFAKIAAVDSDDAGTIVDFGSSESGGDWIRGHDFIAQGNRVATVQVVEWINTWKTKGRDLETFSLDTTGQDTVELNFIRKTQDGMKRYTATMDGDQFRVNRWTYHFESFDGSQWASNIIENKYEHELDAIPRESRSENVSNFSDPTSYLCHLELHDAQPADIEVFSIPGSQTSATTSRATWTRRAAVILIGFFLLGLRFYLRRKSD